VSEFAKTGIIPMCSVNRILFLEKSWQQGVWLCKWIDLTPSEEALTPATKGKTLAPEETLTAAEEASLLLRFLPFPSISDWQVQKISRPTNSPK
jgi:hypothetical protein